METKLRQICGLKYQMQWQNSALSPVPSNAQNQALIFPNNISTQNLTRTFKLQSGLNFKHLNRIKGYQTAHAAGTLTAS